MMMMMMMMMMGVRCPRQYKKGEAVKVKVIGDGGMKAKTTEPKNKSQEILGYDRECIGAGKRNQTEHNTAGMHFTPMSTNITWCAAPF